VVFAFVLVLAGITQQQSEETVTCPVSGKVMKKSEAKASYEYQGKTYYFCSKDEKEMFMKEPEKYLQKKAEMAGCMHMQGCMQMKKGEKGSGMPMQMKAEGEAFCPMMAKDVEVKIENLADGVAVKMTSKNAELVKKIQESIAKMKTMCAGMASCPKKEEVKK